MSHDVFCRIIKGDMNNPAVRQAMEWLGRNAAVSRFDPDVIYYPATSLLQCFDKPTGRPILYVPIQKCFIMEGAGPNPEASEGEVAAAMAQLTKTVAWESQGGGMGEFYLPSTDGKMVEFAQRHGYIRQAYVAKEGEADVAKDIPFLKFKVYRP